MNSFSGFYLYIPLYNYPIGEDILGGILNDLKLKSYESLNSENFMKVPLESDKPFFLKGDVLSYRRAGFNDILRLKIPCKRSDAIDINLYPNKSRSEHDFDKAYIAALMFASYLKKTYSNIIFKIYCTPISNRVQPV